MTRTTLHIVTLGPEVYVIAQGKRTVAFHGTRNTPAHSAAPGCTRTTAPRASRRGGA